MSKITLHTKEEHEKALAEVEKWMLNQSRKMPTARIDALIDAVVEYEKIHYPIGWEE